MNESNSQTTNHSPRLIITTSREMQTLHDSDTILTDKAQTHLKILLGLRVKRLRYIALEQTFFQHSLFLFFFFKQTKRFFNNPTPFFPNFFPYFFTWGIILDWEGLFKNILNYSTVRVFYSLCFKIGLRNCLLLATNRYSLMSYKPSCVIYCQKHPYRRTKVIPFNL